MFLWTAVLKRVAVVVTLVAALLSPAVLQAQPASAAACDTSWTGAISSDWAVAGNWSGGVPDNTKNVCIDGDVETSSGNMATITSGSNDALSVTTSNNGSVFVSGALLTLGAASNFEVLTVGNATVSTAGILNVELLIMNGGTISGAGSLTVADVVFDVSDNTVGVDQTITSSGSWQAGAIINTGHTTTLVDGAQIGSFGIAGTPTFITGGLTVAAGAVADLVGVNVTGPVDVAGSINLNGSLTGSLTQTDGLVSRANDGVVGTLNISGNYTQSGGRLYVQVEDKGTAGTDYDRIVVGGTHAISGESELDLLMTSSSSYAATVGDTFTPLTAASVTGTYETIYNDFGDTFATNGTYGATSITATVALQDGYISGSVHHDDNGDGTLAVEENAGVDGVVVYLDADNDGVKDVGETSSTTIAGGAYYLTAPAGVNNVRVVAPAGLSKQRPHRSSSMLQALSSPKTSTSASTKPTGFPARSSTI